jgi:hypothetical protein
MIPSVGQTLLSAPVHLDLAVDLQLEIKQNRA